MKILHSADWHLGASMTNLDPQARELIRGILLQLPGLMAELCRREKCDLVLLAGDLLEGRSDRDTVEVLKRGLEECGVPVFIAPGNHDPLGPGSPWEEAWPENVHIFGPELESVAVPELDCRIWGAGFTAMDCPPLLEGFRAECEEKWKLCLLHADPTRADSPYCAVTAAQAEASDLDLLALGHIHKGGTFRAGKTLCAWPGCPQGKGWDEAGEKGAVIVTLEEEPKLRAVTFTGPRFYDLDLELENDPMEALKRTLPAGETLDFYRITLKGTGTPDLGALYAAFPGVPHLTLRDRTVPPIDLWTGAGEDTLEGTFFGLLRAAAMEAEGREREQILLAAKISRRLLEGREVKLQ
ncbi:MAG: metallophosphoesterase [Clostridia bacterium]|nr:metallophosphoesterase [Clostridia bacterium]